MKKFFGAIFFNFFIICVCSSISYASNLEQKKYNCLENGSSIRTELKIIKEYNAEYLLGSEHSDFGKTFSFMKISKDNLVSYSMEYKWDVVHENTLGPLKDNKRELITFTYRLTKEQLNEIKQLNSKFSNYSDIIAFELTDKELKNEISIHNKIEKILSTSQKDVVGDPLTYTCNTSNEKTTTSSNSNSSLNLNENDKFACRKDGVSSIIKILEKYEDNYVILYTKFRGNKFLSFGRFTDESLEFFSLEGAIQKGDKGKEFLTINMLTPPVDEKLSYWLFTVSLTDEERNELKKYGTKFDRVITKIPRFNLTNEELKKEIELHDQKLAIIGNIINSEEKVQNQGMTSVTLICKKRNYSN
tara:strand:- start:77 stop:1153 length:1077 start_codon:yes stop_codon:yes gene_type:complete